MYTIDRIKKNRFEIEVDGDKGKKSKKRVLFKKITTEPLTAVPPAKGKEFIHQRTMDNLELVNRIKPIEQVGVITDTVGFGNHRAASYIDPHPENPMFKDNIHPALVTNEDSDDGEGYWKLYKLIEKAKPQ